MKPDMRCFTDEIVEGGPEVQVIICELVTAGGQAGMQGLEFELEGQRTNIRALSERFGSRIVRSFVKRARDNAR